MSRSSLKQEDVSDAHLITGSTSKGKATKRRQYYDQETLSSQPTGKCQTCGKKTDSESRQCWGCYTKLRKETGYPSINCVQCGSQYQIMRAELAKKQRRGQVNMFCSKRCQGDFMRIQRARRCRGCSVPMPGERMKKYCSLGCRQTGIRSEINSVVPEKSECPQCRLPFRPATSRQRYCQKECANAAHSTRMRGAGNSNFKDGQSYALWFRTMRPLILERDGGCVMCGKTNAVIKFVRLGKPGERSAMSIHHVDQNPANNSYLNLVVLCQHCHMSHHKGGQIESSTFASYAANASASMTSKWHETVTSLQTKFSSTTVSG